MKRAVSVILMGAILIVGCAPSTTGIPRLSKLERIAGTDLARAVEQEVGFGSGEARKAILGETITLDRASGALTLAGQEINIPRGEEPQIGKPTYWFALFLAAGAVGLGMSASRTEVLNDDDKSKRDARYALAGICGLGSLLSFGSTSKKRGQAVRYGESAFRRDDFSDGQGGPFRFTIRGSAQIKWTGHRH